MRVCIIGAGPSGLYLAYLLKRRRPDTIVTIVEQNPADATFGFGVVFSDRALEFLRQDDAATFAALTPHLEVWQDITLDHGGERITIDGVGFAAIGRLRLLTILQQQARSVGVEPTYGHPVADLAPFRDADLLVGADGVNSIVRRSHEREFGSTVAHLTNRFAWFGTTRRFETLSQTFRATPQGHFNAHHYRYAPDMGTFLVEVDEATSRRAGLDRLPSADAMALCEEVFADTLQGHRLISNNTTWRQFPKVRNERWSCGNMVLIGDALHTAHFSIGSGTRLAMEDAIALDHALAAHADVATALQAYEASRRPILEKLVAAANASADWYEHFADHMRLAPLDFAMSYITRSGRIDRARLRALSPAFMTLYEARRPEAVSERSTA